MRWRNPPVHNQCNVNTKVINDMVEHLRREYESIFEDGSGAMTVCRGKIHKYLGMTLDFSVKGQVKISMLDYIDEIVKSFEEADPKGKETKSSAAPSDLFTVNRDCKKPPEKRAVQFHNLVA